MKGAVARVRVGVLHLLSQQNKVKTGTEQKHCDVFGAGTVKFLPMVAEGEPKSVIRRCTTTTPRGVTYRSLHRVVVNHGRNNANMRQTFPIFDTATACKAPSWSFLEIVSTGTIVSWRVFPETTAL